MGILRPFCLFASLAATKNKPALTGIPQERRSKRRLQDQRGTRPLARSGEVRKQRHDEKADKQRANDPKVHVLFIARIVHIVSYRPD